MIKTIEPVIYDYPDELLDELFDRGCVDEFDDIHGLVNPKNTLVVHEAAKGGNVPKSYIDYKELKPYIRCFQRYIVCLHQMHFHLVL